MTSKLTNPRKSTLTLVAEDPRWARIVRPRQNGGWPILVFGAHDRRLSQAFVPSRTANATNVQLHDTLESAKATGFRSCKRCNPDGLSIETENAALVAKACKIIEESEEGPSLEVLAEVVGRSPSDVAQSESLPDLHCTPGGSVVFLRDAVAILNMRWKSVTEAIYNAGFSSNGRFHERSTDLLGMTPSQYRAGGANEEIKFAVGQTSLGAIGAASSKKGVAAILLGDDPDRLARTLQDRSVGVSGRRRPGLRSLGGSGCRVCGGTAGGRPGFSPLVFAALLSSNACGGRPSRFRSGRRCHMLRLRGASAHQRRPVRWRGLAQRTILRSPFRVIRNEGSLSGYAWAPNEAGRTPRVTKLAAIALRRWKQPGAECLAMYGIALRDGTGPVRRHAGLGCALLLRGLVRELVGDDGEAGCGRRIAAISKGSRRGAERESGSGGKQYGAHCIFLLMRMCVRKTRVRARLFGRGRCRKTAFCDHGHAGALSSRNRLPQSAGRAARAARRSAAPRRHARRFLRRPAREALFANNQRIRAVIEWERSTNSFPHYSTLDTNLTATQVNLLADLTAWSVNEMERATGAFSSLFKTKG